MNPKCSPFCIDIKERLSKELHNLFQENQAKLSGLGKKLKEPTSEKAIKDLAQASFYRERLSKEVHNLFQENQEKLAGLGKKLKEPTSAKAFKNLDQASFYRFMSDNKKFLRLNNNIVVLVYCKFLSGAKYGVLGECAKLERLSKEVHNLFQENQEKLAGLGKKLKEPTSAKAFKNLDQASFYGFMSDNKKFLRLNNNIVVLVYCKFLSGAKYGVLGECAKLDLRVFNSPESKMNRESSE
ncbi:hypothetical protein POM88_004884 [Heracleum sosnowskyi]|uniref:Uncharacterized protein n=1 Tax=Heracleum sosnowskyi TaxID=360622 RepID=A0AAD8JJ91_9APIA|nr:hypothetical protein POM88_004884 [Heracleum sosnowskyi]